MQISNKCNFLFIYQQAKLACNSINSKDTAPENRRQSSNFPTLFFIIVILLFRTHTKYIHTLIDLISPHKQNKTPLHKQNKQSTPQSACPGLLGIFYLSVSPRRHRQPPNKTNNHLSSPHHHHHHHHPHQNGTTRSYYTTLIRCFLLWR